MKLGDICVLVLCAVLLSPAIADETEYPQIRRTLLLVRDIDRSLDFYSRLGLRIWYEEASEEVTEDGVMHSNALPLSSKPTRGRIVQLMGEESRNGLIALLSFDTPDLNEKPKTPGGLGYGDIMILIEVPDLDAAHQEMIAFGAPIHREPFVMATTIRKDGSTMVGRLMIVYDPDGHLIQIAEVN